MKQLPSNLASYKRTKEFSEVSVPAGLLRRHNTKAGVWGLIHVLEGELRYRILEPEREEVILDSELDGVIEPEVDHQVELVGPVRFYVEFFRQPHTNESH